MVDLRWYLARASAMTPAELVWRAGAGVRVRLVEARDGAPAPCFDDARWLGVLDALASGRRDALVSAAERIAAGELSLWGRRVDVDPLRPDWHADPLTGEVWAGRAWRGSGRDPKAVWELARQQHLVPLAAGARLAGRRDWAELCLAQIGDWIERNPAREGIAWASPYEAAHRLVTWAVAVPLVADAASPSDLARIADAVGEHRRFVAARPSRYSSANNHRLAELAGLLAASVLLDGAGWDPLWAELEREATRQTYADGGSREQAAGYFLYVLEILWTCALLARGAGRGLGRLEERLVAMLGWLAAVADSDGEPPPVGDDAEDRLLRLDYFEPRRAAELAARVAALLGVETPVVATDSVLLAESGYAVLRRDGARIVVDAGELGLGSVAAHGHADALSVLVDEDGRTLLRDTGTGSYVEGRDDDRATAFHNTVVVDGRSQARALGPHLWGRRYAALVEAASLAPELDYVRVAHDGYGETRHTRSVLARAGLVLVLDRVAGRRPVRADLVWQPGPGLPDGPAVVSDPPVACERLPGRYSPRYGTTRPAPRLVWAARGTDVVFATAVPLGGAPLPELALERRGARVEVAVGGLRVREDWSAPVPEVSD